MTFSGNKNKGPAGRLLRTGQPVFMDRVNEQIGTFLHRTEKMPWSYGLSGLTGTG